MSIEIKVPVLPESVADATVAAWYKQVGDQVSQDENLVDIETDKVVLEVVSPSNGVLSNISCPEGTTVLADQVIGILAEEGAAVADSVAMPESPVTASPVTASPVSTSPVNADSNLNDTSPGVRRLMTSNEIDPSNVTGTGKKGIITKEDIQDYLSHDHKVAEPEASNFTSAPAIPSRNVATAGGQRREPMSRIRAKIAERLLQAQQNSAMLTTFNEVDLHTIIAIRNKYQEQFKHDHQVKLGFMSFFVKAVVEALKRYPIINASIDGSDIVYNDFQDIGIAVSSPRGLVVPVLRNAERLTLADIEKSIMNFAIKAKSGKLSLEDMAGGTFSITNGGIFGSMLSTPILNPPQSGILGMHKIQDKPVVVDGKICIRPMMYLALSYDHRLVDGRDSVSFLVYIKELLEEPARLLLEI